MAWHFAHPFWRRKGFRSFVFFVDIIFVSNINWEACHPQLYRNVFFWRGEAKKRSPLQATQTIGRRRTKSKIKIENAIISRLAEPRKTFDTIKNQWQFERGDFFYGPTRMRTGQNGRLASRVQLFSPFFHTAQLFPKVAHQQKLLFVMHPASACGGATEQRETVYLLSNFFTAPPSPGPQTN